MLYWINILFGYLFTYIFTHNIRIYTYILHPHLVEREIFYSYPLGACLPIVLLYSHFASMVRSAGSVSGVRCWPVNKHNGPFYHRMLRDEMDEESQASKQARNKKAKKVLDGCKERTIQPESVIYKIHCIWPGIMNLCFIDQLGARNGGWGARIAD